MDSKTSHGDTQVEPEELLVEAINWNDIPDPLDLDVWHKLVSQFWVPERFPIADDRKTWAMLTPEEKLLTTRVLTGLTLLDTVQGTVGATSLIPDAGTPHEEAVLTNIAFMESVHAKSYSSIFSTLNTTEEINDAFRWSRENEYLQKKVRIIMSYYRDQSHPQHALRRKIASTFLESFLFYSGFYLPLFWSTKAKLVNTADLIRFIIRDEAIHGFYIGAKMDKAAKATLTEEERAELQEEACELLYELYENEERYTEDLYDTVDSIKTEDVKIFLRYNANKALQNLGFDPIFPADSTKVNAAILSSLSLSSENHDFFSGVGTYRIGGNQATTDEDWDFGDDEDDVWGDDTSK